jgi:voltage-gated potassium channel
VTSLSSRECGLPISYGASMKPAKSTVHSPSVSTAEPEAAMRFGRPEGPWRSRAFTIIFESDTSAGRLFDSLSIIAIFASVVVVILDSVDTLTAQHEALFNTLEWGFTLLFTVEYLFRLACVQHPWRYATSLLGVIDLLAVLPTYFAFFVPEVQVLISLRLLRTLRIFRILKLAEHVSEFRSLGVALAASSRKIVVFISFVMIAVAILGSLMYLVEGPENGFSSIPVGIYWAITTITTVGFGDVAPKTDLGRFIASCMMLMGWGILAVPTGIVTSEMTAQRFARQVRALKCSRCLAENLDADSQFCKHCGNPLFTNLVAKPKPRNRSSKSRVRR